MFELVGGPEEFKQLKYILNGIIEGMKIDPIVQTKCIQLK